jgi:ABC-type multidrug transport system ATPase subunit
VSELSIRHGTVWRGRRAVLDAASLKVAAPAAIAVVGINGSGKSSLFMQLAGTLRRGTAEIRNDGRPVSVALVPQTPALPGWLGVEQVARLYGSEFGPLTGRMPALHLDELAGRRASALSAGQRQVLSIALALARSADLTLLDEPFSALDFRRRLGVLELLRQRLEDGGSIMLSSQSSADLVDLGEHFVVIRDGSYVFNGTRLELGRGVDPGGMDEPAGNDERGRIEHTLLQLLT